MQATALSRREETTVAPAPERGNFGAALPLLDLALTETNAQGAYLYYFDAVAEEPRLVAWSGMAPGVFLVPWEVPARAVQDHRGRKSPVIISEDAWADRQFEALPEFRKHRFEGLVSLPLLDGGAVVGMANICRRRKVRLHPREISFLLSLSVPMGALLEAAAARNRLQSEVEKLTQQLADRKLLERAKGLIQSRFSWSEEKAYFFIRGMSRRRRAPMREVAIEVIDRIMAGRLEQDGAA